MFGLQLDEKHLELLEAEKQLELVEVVKTKKCVWQVRTFRMTSEPVADSESLKCPYMQKMLSKHSFDMIYLIKMYIISNNSFST